MNDASVPTMVAGLLCDQVITEAQTNKKTLVGVFDTVYSAALPFTPQIWVYVRLTDAEGKYRFRIELQHLNTEEPIARGETSSVEIPSRLGFYEVVMRLPPISLPKEGTYEFQVFANDIYIGRIVMDAKLLK